MAPWPRLNSTAPLAPWYHRIGWLHIPKCGTSFGTSLAHLANASLPPDAAMGCLKSGCRFPMGIDFILRYPYDEWFRGTFWIKRSTVFANHDSLHASKGWTPNFDGRIFAMLREPSSRARSAYNYFGKHCHRSFASFEAKMQGTAVTMITGQRSYGLHCIACGFQCPPLIPDVQLAKQRLNSFAFVGLTDEWALSVCLLHAMHGPYFHTERCAATEFANSRKASYRGNEGVLSLNATDPYDEELYAEARRRFLRDVQRYAVTPQSCRQRGCWPTE